jgi:DNA-binding FadR family transcriptional regulator
VTERIPGQIRRRRGRRARRARLDTRGPGRRLHGAIALKLGTAILSGQYQPGDILSGEVAFAEELKVSRSAYREAIQVLTAKGLVSSRPKAGTRVQPRERWNLLDPEVLAWAFTGEPDVQFVRDLFELRAVVEPAAARLAAQRRDKADLKAMKDALTLMRRHTLTTEAGRAADRDFHDAILHATHNAAMIVLTASIGAAVHWTTQFKQRRELPRNPIPDHVRVYERPSRKAMAMVRQRRAALVQLALEDTASVIQAPGGVSPALAPAFRGNHLKPAKSLFLRGPLRPGGTFSSFSSSRPRARRTGCRVRRGGQQERGLKAERIGQLALHDDQRPTRDSHDQQPGSLGERAQALDAQREDRGEHDRVEHSPTRISPHRHRPVGQDGDHHDDEGADRGHRQHMACVDFLHDRRARKAPHHHPAPQQRDSDRPARG